MSEASVIGASLPSANRLHIVSGPRKALYTQVDNAFLAY